MTFADGRPRLYTQFGFGSSYWLFTTLSIVGATCFISTHVKERTTGLVVLLHSFIVPLVLGSCIGFATLYVACYPRVIRPTRLKSGSITCFSNPIRHILDLIMEVNEQRYQYKCVRRIHSRS